MNHSLRDDAIGGLQSCFDIAFAGSQFVRNVVAELFMNYRATVRGRFHVDDCGQLFIIDGNQVDRIARCVSIRGHDCCNGMADKESLISGQHPVVRNFQIRKGTSARHRTNLLRDIFTGVNSNNPGRFQSFAHVDAGDTRVRVDRSDKRDVQRVGQTDVIDVMSQSFY